MLGFLIVLILSFSLITAILQGSLDAVCSALLASPQKAVELAVATGCGICLWSGVMEVMRRSGLAEGLTRLLRPVLPAGAGRGGGSCRNPGGAGVSEKLSRPADCLRREHSCHPAQHRFAAADPDHCGHAAPAGRLG